MKKQNTSTRRSFLRGGAILAAPIAAVAVPAAALADNRSSARAERLENEIAIRDLHQSWLRRVNAGERDALLDRTVRRVLADHGGAPDQIEIAADGRSAIGRFDYVVESEMPLLEDGTLAQMARAQGHAAPYRAERRMLTVDYAKTGGSWRIIKVALAVI